MIYKLSHPANFLLLTCGVPAHTLLSIMNLVHSELCAIRDDSLEILDTSETTAAYDASTATVPAFLNGAISTRLPSHRDWIKAYKLDPECAILLSIACDPSVLTNALLTGVHFVYRQPARNGLIQVVDGILFLHELFKDDNKYIKLQLVPQNMQI